MPVGNSNDSEGLQARGLRHVRSEFRACGLGVRDGFDPLKCGA